MRAGARHQDLRRDRRGGGDALAARGVERGRARAGAAGAARRLPRRRERAARRLVLHADDAALLAARRSRSRPSTTAWTSSPSSASRRRSCCRSSRSCSTRADLVFTGGFSLYEAKKDRHPNVHPFPSSASIARISPRRAARSGRARRPGDDLPRPRLGFYGVIDERIDLDAARRGRRRCGPTGRS